MIKIMMISVFLSQIFYKNLAFSGEQRKITTKISQNSFEISKMPEKEDWTFFMGNSQHWRKKLWVYFQKEGKSLKDWSWSWRLAWLRVCELDSDKWCQKVLEEGLVDGSLIVRAKSAEHWGRRFANSKNAEAGKKLRNAYKLKSNDRNGKPMYVKNRILFALNSIGGKKNIGHGLELAKQHSHTLKYWNKLQKYH